MKLSVKDRLVLINILPAQGDFKTMKYLRKYREALSFSEEEQEALNFKNDEKTGLVNWEAEKVDDKEIVAKKPVAKVIRETLEKLDKDEKLTSDTMDLYEKFIGDDEEDEGDAA